MPRPPAARRAGRALAAALLLSLLAAPARAALMAGFETGLDGFTTVGGDGIGALGGEPLERPGPAVAVSVLEGLPNLSTDALDAIPSGGNPGAEGSSGLPSFTTSRTTTRSLRSDPAHVTATRSPTWRDFVLTTLTGPADAAQEPRVVMLFGLGISGIWLAGSPPRRQD
jgi:hypothetical protein